MKALPDMNKPKIRKLLEQDHRKNMIKFALDWFPKEMELELMKHLDRPGWKQSDFRFLFRRLCDETIELDKALFADRKITRKQIIKECIDVANFAMMIADNIK